jgi:two-component system, NarL family, response regulator LiaR
MRPPLDVVATPTAFTSLWAGKRRKAAILMIDISCTRVVVVDDHPVICRGISLSLRVFDDIQVVGEASNGEDALRLCHEVQPDVVIVDLAMPGMGGVATIRALREVCPQAHIVALTSFQEGTLVRDALQAGAIGYLLKDVPVDELAKTIRLTHRGVPTLAQAAAQALVHTVTAEPSQTDGDLTRQERQVLGLVAQGLSNHQVAQRLTISTATVKHHVHGLQLKMGASNRTEIVSLAFRRHLIQLS